MKINKKYKQIAITIACALLLINFISAFGVGSAYYKENPLQLSAGETVEIIFNLQNMAGSETISAKASIITGADIIELVDKENIYSVPVGGSVDVRAKATAPADAKIGDIYPIDIEFTTLTEKQPGVFGFGSGVGRVFDVVIIPSQEQKAKIEQQKTLVSWIVYLIIAIILIIGILWLILKFRKKKKR